MIIRLRTSKESKERLENLNRVLRMSSNAVILRYALAKSINENIPVEEDEASVVSNNSGFEINRVTLFGDNEIVYRLLMGVTDISDDEKFFPYLTNRHIERGLKILEREYKLAGNRDKFILNLVDKIEI